MTLHLPPDDGGITRFRRRWRSLARNLSRWFGDVRGRPRGAWQRRLMWWRLNMAMRLRQRQAFVLWHGPATTLLSRLLAPSGVGMKAPASCPVEQEPEPRRSDGADWPKLQTTSLAPEKYFLFADRHRLYFWIGGVMGSLILFFGQNACPILDERWPWSLTWLGRLIMHPATYFLLFSVYVAPYFVYVVCRRSVLGQFSMQLPDRFMRWMRACVTRRQRPALALLVREKTQPTGVIRPRYGGLGNWLQLVWMVLTSMTPGCSGRGKLAVAYDGLDSRPGRLTRIATTEFFNPRRGDSETSTIGRWLFYGLAPLWVFVLLMTIALITAALTEGVIHRHELLLLDVAWVLLALIFFVVETPRMPVDLGVKPDDLAFLPSQIILPKDALASFITDSMFRLTLNAAVTIIAVVYATLAALIGI